MTTVPPMRASVFVGCLSSEEHRRHYRGRRPTRNPQDYVFGGYVFAEPPTRGVTVATASPTQGRVLHRAWTPFGTRGVDRGTAGHPGQGAIEVVDGVALRRR